MPRGDRTGPNGMGPMTGRAAGYCAGNDQPGFANYGIGGRMGFGRGMGRGFRGGFSRGYGRGLGVGSGYHRRMMNWNGPTKDQELTFLKTQAETVEQELTDIQKRIEELES